MKFNIVFLALAFVAATFASPAPESEQGMFGARAPGRVA